MMIATTPKAMVMLKEEAFDKVIELNKTMDKESRFIPENL